MASHTPLYSAYLSLGANMTEFAGFEMPLWYKGIRKEHQAVRTATGLFDIGHMGILKISGRQSLSLVQKLSTNDAGQLEVGQAQYSIICNKQGGVMDDILVYRLPEYYMLVTNAINYEVVGNWFLTHSGEGCTIDRLRGKKTLLSLQGPKSELTLLKICDIPLPAHHRMVNTKIGLISRTGYTGEDGFEIFIEPESALELWERLLKLGACPCGLGARDSLRLEAALPLYGHEYTLGTTPLEAGFSWAVKFEKGEFIGRQALLRQRGEGLTRKLVGFEMIEKAIPRQGYAIRDTRGTKIGEVTSGILSPTLNKAIGLGYLKKEFAEIGSQVEVEVRGKFFKAVVVPRPFYKRKKEE